METENELLSGYSDHEKGAYISVIASIATADRAATDEEIEFLDALSQGANLSPQQEQAVVQVAQDPSNSQLKRDLDVLKNSQLRFSLVTDIISFAKADGQYTQEEQTKIEQIADYLNINQTQFGALNQFVNEAEREQHRGDNIHSPQQNLAGSSGIEGMLQKAGISSSTLMKGMLGVMAPIVLSKMMGGGRGRMGSRGMGMGGGLLGGLLGGAMGGGMMGGGSSMGRRQTRSGGGLGSIFSMLSGNRGYSGMGSVLGGLLGGRRGGF